MEEWKDQTGGLGNPDWKDKTKKENQYRKRIELHERRDESSRERRKSNETRRGEERREKRQGKELQSLF